MPLAVHEDRIYLPNVYRHLAILGCSLFYTPDMIEQVRCDLTRGLKKAETGRNGLTPRQILRSLVLMRIKNWNK